MSTDGGRQVTGQDLVPAMDGGPSDREDLDGRGGGSLRLIYVVRIVHHDHVFEVGRLLGDRRHPRQQAGCDHQHACARVGQLVGQVLALVGGVHRDRDPSRAHGAGPGQQRHRRVLEQRGHPVVLLGPERMECPAKASAGLHHLTRRELDASHVEVLAVGVGLESAGEELGNGGLLAPRPDAVNHSLCLPSCSGPLSNERILYMERPVGVGEDRHAQQRELGQPLGRPSLRRRA